VDGKHRFITTTIAKASLPSARQNFVSDSLFCFRACKPGPMAPTWCQHIYDVTGCYWNMPANYSAGVFEQCLGDSGEVSFAPAIKRAPNPDPHPYQIRSQWAYMAAQPFIRASR